MNAKAFKKVFGRIEKAPLWTRVLVVLGLALILGRTLGVGPWTKKPQEVQAPQQEVEFQEIASASGILEAEERAVLHFPTSGKLAWLGVEEGDTVRRWQAIAKLDTVKLNSDLQRARSDLREVEATLERVYDEVKGHEADETFEQKEKRTKAEVAKDKIWEAVVKAEKDLREAALISPIAGVVVSTGNLVAGQNVLTTNTIEIVNPASFVFTAQLDEIDYQKISLGQRATVRLDAFPEEEFSGEVILVGSATVTTKAGITAIPVKIKMPADERFIHGLNGDVEFLE